MKTPDHEESFPDVMSQAEDGASFEDVQPTQEPFARPKVKAALDASLQEFDELYRELARQF